MLTITYGGQPARADFDSHGSLFVALERDPGFGSMTFSRISPQCVTVTGGDAADLTRAADSLESGARWIGHAPLREHLRSEAVRLREMAAAR